MSDLVKTPFDSFDGPSPLSKGSPGDYDTEPGYDDRTSTPNGPPQKLYDKPAGAPQGPSGD